MSTMIIIVGILATLLGFAAITAVFLGSHYDEMNFDFEEADLNKEDKL